MKIKCPDCSTSYEINTDALGPEGRSVKCAKCGSRWFVSPEDEEVGTIDLGGTDEDAAAEDDAGPVTEDKDEAEWTADAEEESGNLAEDDEPDTMSEPEDDPDDVAPPREAARAEEKKFAADQAEDGDAADNGPKTDIESQAKRPKIIVNPDKFRRDHISAAFNWLRKRNFRRLGGIALFGGALVACSIFVVMRSDIVKQSPDLASLFRLIGLEVNLRGLEFRNLRTFTESDNGKQVLVVEGSIRNLLDETNAVPAVRLSIRSADQQEIYAWTVEPRTRTLNGLDETRFRTILADPPQGASNIQVRFVDRGKRQIVLE